MPTRNVVLTDHQAELVDMLVRSGRYQNASEVLREGLRLIERRELREAAKLQALREAAQAGFAAVEQGDFKDFESAQELAGYLDSLSEQILSAPRG
jgi:antitoxin ParD1/3/4